jgi:outer membrane lipoprotein SlyB
MKKQYVIAATMIVAAALVSGCAVPNYYTPAAAQPYPAISQPYPASSQSYSRVYGVVDSIQVVQTNDGNSSGNGVVGTVLGGVVGGLLGNQVGGGRGRTVATVAGAVGGAMVGNQIEQRNNTQTRNAYQIVVRLDHGGYQTYTQESVGDLRVGNRVRIDGNRVERY